MDQFQTPAPEEVLKRQAPASREAEKGVLGSLLIDQNNIFTVGEYITGSDFYYKTYGQLFDIITELYNAGNAVDPVTMTTKMREKGLPEEVCNEEFLADLINSVPYSTHAGDYAQIVADKAALRNMIRVADGIATEGYEEKSDVADIMDRAEHEVFEAVQRGDRSDYEPISAVVSRVIDRIEAASSSKGNVTGVASGFKDLDYKTSGFQNSDLILIAARPSMGKTAFALNIADYVISTLKESVVIFSLEMPREQLTQRMIAMETHIDAQTLRNGSLNDDEWKELFRGASLLGQTKLIIDDTASLTVPMMRSKCRRYKMEHDIKMVLVDYLQLINSSGRSESRQNEISEISRALKALARELNVPVIALSQLSRAVEKRDDKRPMLSDLRESGAIEQDADVVMFLYRDEYYNKDTEDKNVAEVIIAKQRNGPTGTVMLSWLPQYTQFRNLEYKRNEE